MNSKPAVTVLMSVYNGEEFLDKAITSILDQSYKDFEFLIIDDGSTDNSLKIIESYKDTRIRLVQNDKNIGLSASLHMGFNLARGKYIARMDADDISYPKRLEKQVRYLEKNPEISLVGSWARFIDQKKGGKLFFITPLSHEAIMAKFTINNGLVHPTIMFCKSDFEKHNFNYNQENRLALEDRELWLTAGKYLRFSNLPFLLLGYRFRANSEGRQIFNLDKKYNLLTSCLERYFENRLDIDEKKILYKFIGMTGYWSIIKPTSLDFRQLLNFIKGKSFNKYERTYFAFAINQIMHVDLSYKKAFTIYEKIYIYYLSAKWLIFYFTPTKFNH